MQPQGVLTGSKDLRKELLISSLPYSRLLKWLTSPLEFALCLLCFFSAHCYLPRRKKSKRVFQPISKRTNPLISPAVRRFQPSPLTPQAISPHPIPIPRSKIKSLRMGLTESRLRHNPRTRGLRDTSSLLG